MAVSKKRSRGKDLALKATASVGGGFLACFIISLAACGVAVKLGNALTLGTWIAALCVLGGAFTAALLGIKLCGKPLYGVYAGLIFTGLLLLVSLCAGGERAYPLQLFGAAAAGTLTAFLAFGRQTPNARKKLKKYVKGA